MSVKKIVYIPESKITKDSITIYGAGKFGEEKIVLDKTRASMLLIELLKFIGYDVKLNKLPDAWYVKKRWF